MTTSVVERNQQRIATVRQLLERNQAAVMAALPNHMDSTRFLRIAMTSLQTTPKLLECTPESFLGAVITAAQLGLEPDGVTGMAYLIPYGGKVNFQPGFQGLMDLARRSGSISQIIPRVVRGGDEFKYHYGVDKDELHHITCEGEEPGAITHVYCIVRMKDGSSTFEVWPVARIEAHRKRYSEASKSKKDSPWESHFEAMAMKTLIIRALKYAPKSVELQKAISYAEMAESGIDQKLDASWINARPATTDPEKPQTQLDKIAETLDGRPSIEVIDKAGDDFDAEKRRLKARKGLLSDDQLAELQKAGLAVGLSAERLSQVLGNEGFASIEEVTAKAFPAIIKYLHGLKPS